jgi:NTE family protein
MTAKRKAEAEPRGTAFTRPIHFDYSGQVVLVLQGGGALGAYQVGVYQALHEAGIEPHWVIGTSIGAINGAIIAGNEPGQRMHQLTRFWNLVQSRSPGEPGTFWPGIGNVFSKVATYTQGIEGFFTPNPDALWGLHMPLGVERAAFYTTAPLRHTLDELIDFGYVNAKHGRLTLGAVNVRSGEMCYFDSRERALSAKHVMASGALPPAFPAIRIDGEPYWDGGVYSNTPMEVVLDDKPRRDSLIFAANVWHPEGHEPDTIWQVLGRNKDIQYASRAKSHVSRQQQIHRLRHIIRELEQYVPEALKADPAVRKLVAYGCATVMHVVPLHAPRIDGEDHTKDIDFTQAGIRARWQAGYADTRRALEQAPWRRDVDTTDGVIVHEVNPDDPVLTPSSSAPDMRR